MIERGEKSVKSSDRSSQPRKGEPPRPSRRKSRAELAPRAREQILAAAASVVSQHGYAGATTKKIADTAGVSEGLIYLYFESRQSILDQLLPNAGEKMIQFIRSRAVGSADLFDMEERAFRAFFDFSSENVGFFRILSEAEVSAPKAYHEHFRTLTNSYRRALQRGIRNGDIRELGSDELDTVIYMLMGARVYLHLRYMKDMVPGMGIPDHVVKTYMTMVRSALQ
jgi:AcrR family transcriptional regulator